MKVAIIIIIVLGVVIVGAPITCQYYEEPYSYYEGYTEELHKGLWVPNIFPKDITEINEQHAIDSNQTWLKFKLGNKSLELSNYIEVDKNNVVFTKPFLSTWWFDDLPSHYKYFKGVCGLGGVSIIAVSSKNKDVYWWCQ